MSGICGIWNFDGRPAEPSLLAKLSGLLAHRGGDGEGRWLDGSIGLAFQNRWTTVESLRETQPLVWPDECVALFDGRLDNREELIADSRDQPEISPASSDATLVSAAYRKYGPGFAERLNGDFAVAIYDIRRRRLFLARDAIGVRPLYYAQAGEAFLLASEVKPILAHPRIVPRPNSDMLAAALLACFGQERQGWTFFEGISSLLPGQLVTVSPDGITRRTYWDFGVPKPIRLRNSAEYAEAFGERFERAVARRLRSAFPVAVALSGGVDSSSIYCTAEKLRQRGALPCPDVVGVSLEVEGEQSDERSFLDDIERQYGKRIQRVPSQVQFATGSLRRAFRDAEAPYFRGNLNSAYPFDRAVRATGARVHLTGTWGDQMVGDGAYLVDLVARLRWITAGAHLAERLQWNGPIGWPRALSWLAKESGRHFCPAPLWRFLRNRGRRLSSQRPWFTADFWNRARRAEVLQEFRTPYKTAWQKSIYGFARPMFYVQALEISNKTSGVNGQEGAFPFLDRDLISFLLAIPGGVTCARGVPKAILRAAMRGVLPATIAERRWKAQITGQLNESANSQFSRFSRYLQADTLCVQFGYVDEAYLKAALPALREGLANGASGALWSLGDILGLELWLQTFFGEKLDEEESGTLDHDERPAIRYQG